MTGHPIPDTALDFRFGWVGSSGSGKTYGAGTGVEKLLHKKHRCLILDPLDVWWGLRLGADGKGTGFDLPIFGGSHGDLPLTRSSGALIGETVAGMRESCIVSFADLDSDKAMVEFATAFLDALFRHASGELFHLIVDEADVFAPQHPEAHETRMLGLMNRIVRRGRVKGFIPWLITQRPAVLSKNVLSMMDGLVAMRLTSPQDRKALGSWIEGQADRDQGKEILAALPGLQNGEGYFWLPRQKILEQVKFPAKVTYDSSRSPKRGEKIKAVPVKPLDLGALKAQLAKVEEETKANDPKALKAKIGDLERLVGKADPAALKAEYERGKGEAELALYDKGTADGRNAMALIMRGRIAELQAHFESQFKALIKEVEAEALEAGSSGYGPLPIFGTSNPRAPVPLGPNRVLIDPGAVVATKIPSGRDHRGDTVYRNVKVAGIRLAARAATPSQIELAGDAKLGKGERAILIAISQQPAAHGATREALTVLTGYKRSSRDAYIQRLRQAGLVEERGAAIFATDAGIAALGNDYERLPEGSALREWWLERLPEGERKILERLAQAYPSSVARDVLSDATGYKRSTRDAYIKRLNVKRLVVIDTGDVRASELLFD